MKRLLPVILALIMVSCDEVIRLDPGQTDQKIIIDALLTDDPALNYVRITRNVDFYYRGDVPGVDGATISVTDDLGNFIDYAPYVSSDPDSTGYYFPSIPFVGQVDRIYTLEVTIGGITYTASDQMFSNFELDSLSVRKDPDPSMDDINDNLLYQALFFGNEPQDTKDYYYFEFFANDSLQRDDTQVFISDDTFLAGQISGLEFPYNYALGDTAKIRVFSVSRGVYFYFADLANILGNDGGMFSPPPANPASNFDNGALGVFQVSSVREASILIEE